MSVSLLPPTTWEAGTFVWGAKTFVMAIINATPDSFSGDGIAGNPKLAGDLAVAAVANGADVIDIGAESTRPGHQPVDARDELARLLPVLEAVATRVTIPISVDTSKAAVADAALHAGASMVNDIRGFTKDPELASVVSAHSIPAVIMHDVPPDGRGDLLTEIVRELSRRLDRALAAGIAWERLIVDPGFGFGKDWRQNLELLRRLGELRILGRPILVGTSRKGTIGRVLGLVEQDRAEGTAATITLAIAAGADMVRIHDVQAMARVTRMTDAVIRGLPAGHQASAGAFEQ
ncbi:MAG: dihydropteroate synthase [Chloroflexota bacterium]|nr:dihydropteroate synthase [Chloroflexota bacterium]